MKAIGWTMEELAKELNIPENTVMQRIHRQKIGPIYRGSIYPPDTLDRIRDAPMGRPKAKPEATSPIKPAKKSKE
jgi:hypothetical protein